MDNTSGAESHRLQTEPAASLTAQEELDRELEELEKMRLEREQQTKLVEMGVEHFSKFGLEMRRGRYPILYFESEKHLSPIKEELVAACQEFSTEALKIANIEIGYSASDLTKSFTVIFGEEASVKLYSDEIDAGISYQVPGSKVIMAHSHPEDSEGKFANEWYSMEDLNGFLTCVGASEMNIFAPTGTLTLVKTIGPELVRERYNALIQSYLKKDGPEGVGKFLAFMVNLQAKPYDELEEGWKTLLQHIGFRYEFVPNETHEEEVE